MYQSSEQGVTIVEVIVGTAISALVLVFISLTLSLFFRMSDVNLTRTQALYLAEEGHEMIRFLRDTDWDILNAELSNDTTYYLNVTPTAIATTTAPEVIDGVFTRSFELSEVRRDSVSHDIVASGGVVDADARYITFNIDWGASSVTTQSLLSNLYGI